MRELLLEFLDIVLHSLFFVGLIAWVFVCIRVVIWLGSLILV